MERRGRRGDVDGCVVVVVVVDDGGGGGGSGKEEIRGEVREEEEGKGRGIDDPVPR